MKKELEEIIKRLDKIEELLKEKYPQNMCGHDWQLWQLCEGSSTFPMYICKKCGAYKSDNPYQTTS